MPGEKVPFSRREKLLSAVLCLLTVLSLSLFASYRQAANRLSAELDKASAIAEAETTALQTETETETETLTEPSETTPETEKLTEKPAATQKKSTGGTKSTKPAKATPSSPVNINAAGLKELCRLQGIGEVKAQAIIDYRNTYGPFESKEDLMKVKGIGEKTFDNIKDCIVL
ncbi:MAG: helix-hairpin-helix domain-containing protein [Clostridiales bacterium]|nr:helix-hairpin-helix domain-containing protein [Clostridiales bacterium]